MGYITQGNNTNCGAFATAYYIWECQKQFSFRTVRESRNTDGDEDFVDLIYNYFVFDPAQTTNLVAEYCRRMNITVNQLDEYLGLVGTNLHYNELWRISDPVNIANYLVRRQNLRQNDITIHYPSPDREKRISSMLHFCTVNHNYHDNIANNIKMTRIVNTPINHEMFDYRNACLELVYAVDPKMGAPKIANLHYVLSYRNIDDGKIYFINPHKGISEERGAYGIISKKSGDYKLLESGMGIMLPRP